MHYILSSRRVATRLALALALPLLGLAAFAGLRVLDRHWVSSDMERLTPLAELAPTISGVVHELQKERGNSAGYIGAKGGAFGPKLEAQRKTSDRALRAFGPAMADFDAAAYGAVFQRELLEVRQSLQALERQRAKVADFSVTVGDMAAYYTGTIANLLDLVEAMPALISSAEVTGRIAGYIALLQAKERAGLERAMGSNGFGAGVFAQPVYRRFVELAGAQQAYLDVFATFATPEQADALNGLLTGGPAQEVNRLRDIAVASGSYAGIWVMTV